MVPEVEYVIQVLEVQQGFEGEFSEDRFLPMGQVNVCVGWSIFPAHRTTTQLEVVVIVENEVITGECEVEQLNDLAVGSGWVWVFVEGVLDGG